MTPTEYTEWRRSIDIYPDTGFKLGFYTLGLTGEAGEIAEKVKRVYRDGKVLDGLDIAKECGDVLWYLTGIADKHGYTLQDVIDLNYKKLTDRHARGVGHGDGDNR